MASVTGTKFSTSPATVIPRGVAGTGAFCAACCVTGARRAGLQIRRTLPGSDAADLNRRLHRQRSIARPRAVGVENERREIDVGLVRQRSGRTGRHRRAHKADQIARGLVAPLSHEVRAGQLRPFASGKIRRVAHGAVDLVRGAPGLSLLGCVRRAALLRDHCQTASGGKSRAQTYSSLRHPCIPPHRL